MSWNEELTELGSQEVPERPSSLGHAEDTGKYGMTPLKESHDPAG